MVFLWLMWVNSMIFHDPMLRKLPSRPKAGWAPIPQTRGRLDSSTGHCARPGGMDHDFVYIGLL